MPSPLLILGASTRSAAFSAVRAGFQPICGDLFADADLCRVATVIDLPQYPMGLAQAACSRAPIPWIYTGALENWPSQIEAVSKVHHLLGNRGEVLKTCRDPEQLRQILVRGGFPALEIRNSDASPLCDATWLCKPLRSAGGRGVAIWNAEATQPQEPHYFQRYCPGVPISAAFLAGIGRDQAGWAELLGVSCQLSGLPNLNAPPFGYCGSLVPSRIADLGNLIRLIPQSSATLPNDSGHFRSELNRLGSALTQSCHLRGLFGIDFIWNGSAAWVLEVNPRYTASMELLEQSLNRPLLQWHFQACDSAIDNSETLQTDIRVALQAAEKCQNYFGKVIPYANRRALAPDLTRLIPVEVRLGTLPSTADIPVTGSVIEPGQPVLTCLGQDSNPERLLNDLINRSHSLWQSFDSVG